MVKKKRQETQEEQSRRFMETARKHESDEDPGSFERAVGQVSTAEPAAREQQSEMTWYVAYSLLPASGVRTGQGERFERFPDEAGAKKYARQIAPDRKLRIRSGTLPGVTPPKQIDPAEIEHWLEPAKKTHG